MANITFSEASGVNKSIYGDSQAPIRSIIEKRAEAFESTSVALKIFKPQKSTHWAEKYTAMTAMDGFWVTGENGAVPTDGMEESYSQTLEAVTWKDGFSISREIIEDGTNIDLKKRPQGFITAYHRTREVFAAALIGGAIAGSTPVSFRGGKFKVTCADGNSLFYASHPAKVKGPTQCNRFSDAFNDDSLGALETQMQNTCGDNEEPLDITPDTIIIPNVHSLKKAVFAAVGADKDPDTANNGFNYQFGRWNIIVWNYLNKYVTLNGTAIPWLLMDSRYNQDYESLIWQERIPLDVRSWVDENTHANQWSGYARFTAGFADWRAIAVAGVDGATAMAA